MSYQPLTKKDVKKEVLDIFSRKKKEFTTLELKKSLRDNGFYAIQKDVSKYLLEIVPELNLQYTNNGVYNTYYPSDHTGKKNTKIADSFNSKSSPLYNSVVDILCKNHPHLDCDHISGSDQLKFDLGLSDDEIKEVLTQAAEKNNKNPDNIKFSNINIVRDIIVELEKNPDKVLNMISSNSTKTEFYINKNQKTIETSSALGVSGNWKVYSVSLPIELEFDSMYTRDEVRLAYSKICGVKFVNVRSKKIK